MDRRKLAALWYEIITHPLTGPGLGDWLPKGRESDSIPQPGYVGKRYAPKGTLLLAMNPGRGPETEHDRRYHEALKALRDDTSSDHLAAFERLNDVQEQVGRTWPYYRVLIRPILDALGVDWVDVAYVNLHKLRTTGKPKHKSLSE